MAVRMTAAEANTLFEAHSVARSLVARLELAPYRGVTGTLAMGVAQRAEDALSYLLRNVETEKSPAPPTWLCEHGLEYGLCDADCQPCLCNNEPSGCREQVCWCHDESIKERPRVCSACGCQANGR